MHWDIDQTMNENQNKTKADSKQIRIQVRKIIRNEHQKMMEGALKNSGS